MPKVIANRGDSNDRSGREVPSLTPQRIPTPVNALTKNQVLGNIANEIGKSMKNVKIRSKKCVFF